MEVDVIEKEMDNHRLGISGLGGWLIFVQFGLYFTILIMLTQLFQFSLPAFSPETWNVLTSTDSELYHPLWGPLLVFETICNVSFLAFSVFILFNFYRRKSILPRLMIIFYSVSFIIGVVDTILVLQIPLARETEDGSSIRDIIKSILTCAIWIPYFIKSVRVKNTFVR
ncbi:DUF2569 domain-containing protein [Paenibacillus sp. CMAA1364]